MIGNDIVDLDLAKRASNWKRKGFLDKIFTSNEQELILSSTIPDTLVWNLWTRKEAAYKIYNRQMGIRGFFPLRMECHYTDQNYGTVSINDFIFYTKTEITNDYLYTVAINEKGNFDDVKTLELTNQIKKENGIPFRIDLGTKHIIPVSITHHGKFKRIISL
ncbi:4'-phosphopantetheinyl transferase superfamily protein [Flavobacterium sp. N3904]|uniref:4'-phosphopantetheinyl transferase family protein n=1 Tax=Flavobacterium sp. N3904 TaxID=2986835 RepID=UPI0022245656|nr:4'-phosphopantetheinyl transferase superfamily protein [Flavobacterium sp. N3904]